MKYFNSDMTYPEAQKKLFTIMEGKSKEEIGVIKREYSAILPIITQKEMRGNALSLTEHSFDAE